MKAVIKVYAPLLKQAYYANRTGSIWTTLIFLALGITAFLLQGLALGAWRTGVNTVCGTLAVVIFIWWGAFVGNAIQQNSPTNACLTPRLRRRLITLTVSLSTLCVLSMSALAATAMGHFAYWLVGVAFVFPYMLASARYPTFSFLPFVLIFSSASVFERPIKQMVDLVTAYGDLPFAVVGLLLMAAVSAWLLPRAFPAGGDRHIDWVRSSADTLARLKLAGTTSASTDGVQPLWRPGRGTA